MAIETLKGRTRLDNIEVHGVRNLNTGRFTVTGLTIDGQLVIPTTEFWNDLFHRFNLTAGWADGKSNVRRFEWLVAHFGEYEVPYCLEITDDFDVYIYPSPKDPCVKGAPKDVIVLSKKRAVWNKRQMASRPASRSSATHSTSEMPANPATGATVARPGVPSASKNRCGCRASLKNCLATRTQDSGDCPHDLVLGLRRPANQAGQANGYRRLLKAIHDIKLN